MKHNRPSLTPEDALRVWRRLRSELEPGGPPVDYGAICLWLSGDLREREGKHVTHQIVTWKAWHDAYQEVIADLAASDIGPGMVAVKDELAFEILLEMLFNVSVNETPLSPGEAACVAALQAGPEQQGPPDAYEVYLAIKDRWPAGHPERLSMPTVFRWLESVEARGFVRTEWTECTLDDDAITVRSTEEAGRQEVYVAALSPAVVFARTFAQLIESRRDSEEICRLLLNYADSLGLAESLRRVIEGWVHRHFGATS